jgi:hypothetical protein
MCIVISVQVVVPYTLQRINWFLTLIWVMGGVEPLVVDAPIRIEMETMEHSLEGSFYDQSIYDYTG